MITLVLTQGTSELCGAGMTTESKAREDQWMTFHLYPMLPKVHSVLLGLSLNPSTFCLHSLPAL